ncbi:MAG: class I SAM-dependent RNA methyltransferase, partial [Rhodothermaceae bacterium]
MDLKGRFPVLIKTMYGLEDILADELKQSGIKEIEIQNRAVSCVLCKEELYRLNIKLRTALRILIPLYEFEAWNEEQFYKRAKKYDWISLFP